MRFWSAFQMKKEVRNVYPWDYTYIQTLRRANRNAIADPTPCKRVGLPQNIQRFALCALLVWSCGSHHPWFKHRTYSHRLVVEEQRPKAQYTPLR